MTQKKPGQFGARAFNPFLPLIPQIARINPGRGSSDPICVLSSQKSEGLRELWYNPRLAVLAGEILVRGGGVFAGEVFSRAGESQRGAEHGRGLVEVDIVRGEMLGEAPERLGEGGAALHLLADFARLQAAARAVGNVGEMHQGAREVALEQGAVEDGL